MTGDQANRRCPLHQSCISDQNSEGDESAIVMPPKKRGRKKNNDEGASSSRKTTNNDGASSRRHTRNNGGAGPSRPVIIDLDEERWKLRGEDISIFHPELEYGTHFILKIQSVRLCS